MNAILTNLCDPSWWFTGIFFILVALALPPILGKAKIWLSSITRGISARKLRAIKRIRRDPLLISYEISKESANYILFMLVCFVYLFSFLLIIHKISTMIALIISLPLYMFEIRWIQTNIFVKEILDSRDKIKKVRETDS